MHPGSPRHAWIPRAARFVAAACALASLAPRSAVAAWATDGVRVAPADSAQVEVAIAADGAGGAFIGWEEKYDPYSFGAVLLRLAPDGAPAPGWPAGGRHLLGGAGYDVALIPDGAGGVYAAVQERNPAVRLIRIAGDGTTAAGWPINGYRFSDYYGPYAQGATRPGAEPLQSLRGDESFLPAMVLDGSGGVLLTWTFEELDTDNRVRLARYTATGQPAAGWAKNGLWWAGYYDENSVACSDGVGGAFVAFDRDTWVIDHGEQRIAVAHVDANAGVLWVSLVCSEEASAHQDAAAIVSDGAGGAIVLWRDSRAAPVSQVFAQHVLSDGSHAPGWPDTGLAICTAHTAPGSTRTLNGHRVPLQSAVSDGAGGAYVAWTDYRADAAHGDIYTQHVRGDGTVAPGWPENGLVVCAAAGDQELPTVSEDGAGGLLVTWQDARGEDYDVYVQRLEAGGMAAPGWPADGAAVCTAEGDQEIPVVAADGTGGAIVAWVDRRGPQPQIYAAGVTYDGLVSTLPASVSAEATIERVRLEWYATAWRGDEVTIERSYEESGWVPVANVWPEGDGRIVYEDLDVVPGAWYGYRLSRSGDSAGETWLTVPARLEFSLEPPRPNPGRSDLVATFALPDERPARLQVLDVTGREVWAREVGGLGPGRHSLALGAARLSPGVYVLRLARPDGSLTHRAVIVR